MWGDSESASKNMLIYASWKFSELVYKKIFKIWASDLVKADILLDHTGTFWEDFNSEYFNTALILCQNFVSFDGVFENPH